MPTPSADPATVAACEDLLDALPIELEPGISARPVLSDPRLVAAWGEPPVVLECGAPPLERDQPDFQLGPPDGTGFVTFKVRDVGAATRFTTDGLRERVAVTVPDAYDSQVLVPLTGPLLDQLAG